MNKQREMASGVVYTLQPRGPEIGKRASTVLMGDVLRTNNRVFLVSLSSVFFIWIVVSWDGLLKVPSLFECWGLICCSLGFAEHKGKIMYNRTKMTMEGKLHAKGNL